ncbi:MAG TPA: hypothetical protein VMB79_16430 [Jatrophihabitans sp.]|nr:hypothetical protein [Jatrophihabitans sp.]
MTVVPVWAALLVSVGTPLLTFVSAVAAHRANRTDATDVERRSRREQVLHTLQWAAELALDPHPGRSTMGLAQLLVLADSDLSGDDVKDFVTAAPAALES